MNGVRVAGDQRMPPGQVFAVRHQPVSAAGREPFECGGCFGGEAHAVGYLFMPGFVRAAAAGADIEQFAGDARIDDFAGVLVFEFQKAAARAAVAERLPFLMGHLLEAFSFPKWQIVLH